MIFRKDKTGCVCFFLLFIRKSGIYVIHTLLIVVNGINSVRKRIKKIAISVQMTYILEITTDNHLHRTVKI